MLILTTIFQSRCQSLSVRLLSKLCVDVLNCSSTRHSALSHWLTRLQSQCTQNDGLRVTLLYVVPAVSLGVEDCTKVCSTWAAQQRTEIDAHGKRPDHCVSLQSAARCTDAYLCGSSRYHNLLPNMTLNTAHSEPAQQSNQDPCSLEFLKISLICPLLLSSSARPGALTT